MKSANPYQMSATCCHLNKKPLGSRFFYFTSWQKGKNRGTASVPRSNSKQRADNRVSIHCNTDSPVLLCGEKVNVSPVRTNRVLQKTESKCKASGLLE
ncbi:MAG: hypothetical protein LBV74_14340 [Tannerella sp.]|nr:hypothetical protein [Tannerella sp.]